MHRIVISLSPLHMYRYLSQHSYLLSLDHSFLIYIYTLINLHRTQRFLFIRLIQYYQSAASRRHPTLVILASTSIKSASPSKTHQEHPLGSALRHIICCRKPPHYQAVSETPLPRALTTIFIPSSNGATPLHQLPPASSNLP